MKKRLFGGLLALALIATLLPTAALAALASEKEFVIEDGVLLQYTGPGGDIVIPDGVTRIDGWAFYNCSSVSSVTFPNSLTSIGSPGFYLNFLEVRNFPDNITQLGRGALGSISPATDHKTRVKIWKLMAQGPQDPQQCVTGQSASVVEASEEITEGLGNDYEKAEAICKWVSRNIAYDYGQYYQSKPYEEYSSVTAEDVLATRLTTCDGYANLTAALLNAQNIPAIVCSGLAGENGDWGGHAWNEAYVDGRWIHIDTTFGHAWFDLPLERFAQDHILWDRPVATQAKNCDAGHTWGKWKVTKSAMCDVAGEEQRTCSVCGKSESRVVATTDHYYRNVRSEIEETRKSFNGKSIALRRYTELTYECYYCGDRYLEHVEESAGDIDYFTVRRSYYDGLFLDVSDGQWFSQNVSTAYSLGLMNGTGGDSFSPNAYVTLAEAVTLASRIHSIYYTQSEDSFGYSRESWYAPYLIYAREFGIDTAEYGDYTRPATRDEFVHIMAQALPEEELSEIPGTLEFADSRSITHQDDVNRMSRAGIINGIRENGKLMFKPEATITRAEVAAVVGRMVQPETRTGR